MSQFTRAYSKFVRRLEEIDALQRLAKQTSRESVAPQNLALVNALCRGGVVLLCSHIEGYVEDLGETAVDQVAARGLPKTALDQGFRYYLSRDLITDIGRVSDPPKVARRLDDLFQRDGHIWDNTPNFTGAVNASAFIGNFSNPTFDRIASFFGRFGYKDYKRDLGRRLAANYAPCTNMIDQVVSQRNAIAHGDFVATGTPTDLSQMMALVRLFCRETDRLVADWFRAKGCPIR